MNNDANIPIQLTDFAAKKVKFFIENEIINSNSRLKLRIYIIGGGCSGFQYGFVLDDKVSNDDYIIENNGASLVIDPMSLQYLFGGTIDYYEGLEGSRFVVINPNAKNTCSCGSSFSV
ncbi:iron-sulfur cluster insertion protein ErpA [Blochmannia endosymbiont of Camponotus sp. C-003]|uniref:iron-sulfur cluster insertion protein ErpA n=1 Tax=unclassified Candidatus Blochmanniella TaxID=711328 RepID=UPI002024BFCC|nr:MULTISPECIES: iron-sulfur cluster insertion protein ErpA [unclassified Candidatus Blochmannia]URJ23088.1 iron-sulfur cluster insertion protein ErpA [Blochmannia endosymbiont of Camponotus sp. C-003]URJ28555.1 iron-sulfur cluster insertion protein ErpA [Blochmannia endosymbiont of Camponotus sp. C-046]